MKIDELEFAISQYLDGTLPPIETAALEERLASDAEARALLDEYRRLNTAIRASSREPSIAWERLSRHLSDSVSRHEPPVRHYSLTAWRQAPGVALAACLALVFAVAFVSYRSGVEFAQETAALKTGYAIIDGPQPETAPHTTPVITQIAVGPAPTMSESWRYAESVISRPAIVMIDRGSRPVQDIDSFW